MYKRQISEGCGVWYNAVLRADRAPVVLGKGSNVQDCSVLHVDYDTPCMIGEYVTIGHNATVHACTVKDYALIGMGATVLNLSLIHIYLSQDQLKKTGALVVEGEALNVLIGSEPLNDEDKDAVKENIINIIQEKYNFSEEDFISAELEVVPAGRAREMGLDLSLIHISRGDIAYTVFDLNSEASAEAMAKLGEIDGMIKIREI